VRGKRKQSVPYALWTCSFVVQHTEAQGPVHTLMCLLFFPGTKHLGYVITVEEHTLQRLSQPTALATTPARTCRYVSACNSSPTPSTWITRPLLRGSLGALQFIPGTKHLDYAMAVENCSHLFTRTVV
jgi:hypothetical protein